MSESDQPDYILDSYEPNVSYIIWFEITLLVVLFFFFEQLLVVLYIETTTCDFSFGITLLVFLTYTNLQIYITPLQEEYRYLITIYKSFSKKFNKNFY